MKRGATAKEKEAPKEVRLIRAIRCEVVKPLNESWDEFGALLRTIRSVSHRLYTAAALAGVRVDRAKRIGRPEIDDKGKEVVPATAAYREIEIELESLRDWAKKKRNQGEERATIERLGELELPGSMKSCISQTAMVGVQRWLNAKQRERVPTWKHGAPIPCRANETSFMLADDKAIVMSVQLRPAGRVNVLLNPGRGSNWAKIRALATEEDGVKHGDVKLTYSEREKKWFAIVAFSEPMPKPPELDETIVMVIHRGHRNLLVAGTNHGHYSVLSTGAKLYSFKQRMAARRKSYQSITRGERGRGASGHGRKRRYSLPERLSEVEANFVKTLCQQMGARIVELAKRWGAGTVLIEDYGGIEPSSDDGKATKFPMYQLRQSVEWSLKKNGMKLGTYEHFFMSQTCPACGNVDEKQHNRRTGVFHCKNCGYDRSMDEVSVIFALRKACGSAGFWEEPFAKKKK